MTTADCEIEFQALSTRIEAAKRATKLDEHFAVRSPDNDADHGGGMANQMRVSCPGATCNNQRALNFTLEVLQQFQSSFALGHSALKNGRSSSAVATHACRRRVWPEAHGPQTVSTCAKSRERGKISSTSMKSGRSAAEELALRRKQLERRNKRLVNGGSRGGTPSPSQPPRDHETSVTATATASSNSGTRAPTNNGRDGAASTSLAAANFSSSSQFLHRSAGVVKVLPTASDDLDGSSGSSVATHEDIVLRARKQANVEKVARAHAERRANEMAVRALEVRRWRLTAQAAAAAAAAAIAQWHGTQWDSA